eukprot:3205865-Pyramimonas_sp.AAC.1
MKVGTSIETRQNAAEMATRAKFIKGKGPRHHGNHRGKKEAEMIARRSQGPPSIDWGYGKGGCIEEP